MSNVAIVLFSSSGWDRSAEGVAGAGSRLAAACGGSLHAVLVGPADEATRAGAAAIASQVKVLAQQELAEYQPELALAAVAEALSVGEYKAVLLANDTYSQELTPLLAARLGGAPMADGQDLKVEDGTIFVQRSAYGGKALAVYAMNAEPAVVWVRARALEPATEAGTQGTVEEVTVDLPEPRLRITERLESDAEGAQLEEADVIVSGGRGLGGPEPFETLLKELAEVMGAEQGASRAACDAGWVPPNWQVGQTGKKVAPELYLAIAISGASQHLLGMGDSKVVAAINTDPDAPIFKHCSFGIVEDYKNVVPGLTERLRDLKG